MVKSYWLGGVVAHVILVTAPVPGFWCLGIWVLGTWLVNLDLGHLIDTLTEVLAIYEHVKIVLIKTCHN